MAKEWSTRAIVITWWDAEHEQVREERVHLATERQRRKIEKENNNREKI